MEKTEVIKNFKFYATNKPRPLDVPLYAFGQTKTSLKPCFCSVCPFCIFFPIP